MLPAHITPAELEALRKTLVDGYTIKVEADILDMDCKVLHSLSSQVLDGQVNVDLDAEVKRSATINFLDPHNTINLDTDSPDDGALYADRMLRIRQRIRSEYLPDSLTFDAITGPISKIDRSGPVLVVEVQGMEALGLGEAWIPQTWPKGARKTDIIRELLVERCGIKRMDIPTLSSRLPGPITMTPTDKPLLFARRIALGMNKQLLITADGRAVLRDWPGSSMWMFGNLYPLGEPKVTPDFTRVRNAVRVFGRKAKGTLPAIVATAVAPRDHALSPWRIGPTGSPRYLPETVEDENIKTTREAQALADRMLADLLREDISVEVPVLPVYHLEPGDLVHLNTDQLNAHFRMRQYSYPLTAGGTMSLGKHMLVSPNRRRIRT